MQRFKQNVTAKISVPCAQDGSTKNGVPIPVFKKIGKSFVCNNVKWKSKLRKLPVPQTRGIYWPSYVIFDEAFLFGVSVNSRFKKMIPLWFDIEISIPTIALNMSKTFLSLSCIQSNDISALIMTLKCENLININVNTWFLILFFFFLFFSSVVVHRVTPDRREVSSWRGSTHVVLSKCKYLLYNEASFLTSGRSFWFLKQYTSSPPCFSSIVTYILFCKYRSPFGPTHVRRGVLSFRKQSSRACYTSSPSPYNVTYSCRTADTLLSLSKCLQHWLKQTIAYWSEGS